MSLILNNSRDINNKFLFGHWMMRTKDGQLPFRGPGYGRVNYWMANLDAVEKEMKEMRRIGLKCYVIELCGSMSIGDGCWDCCKNDTGGEVVFSKNIGSSPTNVTKIDTSTVSTNYFEDVWYKEVKEKYQKIVKLCRKYNLWLLTIVFNCNRWEKAGQDSKLEGWIRQYDAWDPKNLKPGSSSAGMDGEHNNLTRQRELEMAIKETAGSIWPDDKPKYKDIIKLINEVVIPINGRERVIVNPVNEPSKVTSEKDGEKLEEEGIKILKGKGFATCSYGDDPPPKYGAREYQGGHNSHISNARCKAGIGISDNGTLLCELYYSDPEDKKWEDIGGSDKVVKGKAKELIKKYKQSGAHAAMIYAIHYNSSSVDTNALEEIKEGWSSA